MKFTKQAFEKISFVVLCMLLFMHATFASAQPKKPLTLEDFFASPKFSGNAFQGVQWAEKGPVITFVKPDDSGGTDLISYDLERDQQTVLVEGAKLHAAEVNRLIAIQNYAFSADRSRLLIYTDSAPVWRYPTKGYYYLYDFATQKLAPISSRKKGDPENVQLKTIFDDKESTWVEPFDPFGGHPKLVYLEDGKHVLYQSECDGYNHLYLYKTEGGPARQITRGAWEAFFGFFHAYLVQQHQVIVAGVDNRGAAGYGKAFESAMHKNMGTVEAQDQIAAAKYFGALPYIDEKRIVIWDGVTAATTR